MDIPYRPLMKCAPSVILPLMKDRILYIFLLKFLFEQVKQHHRNKAKFLQKHFSPPAKQTFLKIPNFEYHFLCKALFKTSVTPFSIPTHSVRILSIYLSFIYCNSFYSSFSPMYGLEHKERSNILTF